MGSVFFVIGFILFLIFVAFTVKKINLHLFLSIPGFFLIMYFIFDYIGIITLYFKLDEYRVNIGVNDQNLILKLWIYSVFAIVLVLLGFYICKKILKMNFDINKFSELNLIQKGTKIILLIIFVISLIVFILYLRKLPAIPIIELVLGTSEYNIRELRSLSTTAFPGKYHWYTLFFSSILSLLTFILFAEFLLRKNIINFIFFTIVFLTTSFAALVPTHKAPFIWLIIGLVITYILVEGKKIHIKYIFFIGVSSILTLIVMYKNFMGLSDRSYSEIINTIFSRLTTGQLTPAYFYLKIFPEEISYLYGKTFPNPGGIFPWTPFPLTKEVAKYINPEIENTGIVATAPTAYWGEMYANFGLFGILLSSLLVGILLYSIQYYVLKLPLNTITVGLNVWLIIEFHKLTLSGLFARLLDIDLFIVLFISVIIISINQHLQNRKINSNGRIKIEESINDRV